MKGNLKICENVIDDVLKDLVLITKSMKTMSFTPQRIQDFLLQLVEKHSIPLFSDLLTE
ncbi:hypothetical protein LCGC14_1005010 [marine sediment metagenome]|uniref:Uncharacterized protein n=1 Tax=marine sediment metagenome TaxID=412755 RepID=A0A0F9R802_9ZZZZ